MRFRGDLKKLEGRTVLMLGNEAVAWGALEGGIGVATAYPGTPSSEIVESLVDAARELGFWGEWAVNEKVAFEIAYSAAISGINALVAMKHVGMNVAADPLMSSAYTGVRGSLVIVTADDPSMWSSQNEQDNRYYGLHAYIPVFEPHSPSEAKELTKYLFDLSRRIGHPVILRMTTRISHTRGPVKLGKINVMEPRGKFIKEDRFVLIPANARRNRLEMLKRWEKIKGEIERIRFNNVEGEGDALIVAPGIAYAYVKEAVRELGLEGRVRVLKLSSVVPVPRGLLLRALDGVKRVLVVEELEDIVEKEVKAVVAEEGLGVEVKGKEIVGYPYELTLARVRKSIQAFLGHAPAEGISKGGTVTGLPVRPPVLCPGCPYRPLFTEVRRLINQEKLSVVAAGDIGCYSLGYNKPYRLQDIIIEMGGSIGTGIGLANFTDDVVISILGDSTFFHAGLPPLANAVYMRSPLVVIVLDNMVTAMTGHQPSPSTKGVPGRRYIPIEETAKGLGVRFVKVIDPFDMKEVRRTVLEAIKFAKENSEPAVIVARRRCALEVVRDLRRAGVKFPPYIVQENKCIACRLCYDFFACPAIFAKDDGKAYIDPELCVGCSACAQVCPTKAIVPAEEYDKDKVESFWR